MNRTPPPSSKEKRSTGSICGGTISSTEWKRLGADAPLMAFVRTRVRVRGHYRYLIFDPLSDTAWWEER